MSSPRVCVRFLSGKEVVLRGKTPRHLLGRLRAEVSTVPEAGRGFNFKFHDGRGNEIEVDAELDDGAEYTAVAMEVCQSTVHVEINESCDVLTWSCNNWNVENCKCDKCIVRPPGKECGTCGRRFTGDLSECPMCFAHRQSSAASSASRYWRKRDLGVCVTCYCPAVKGRARCRYCMDEANVKARVRLVLKKTK